MTQHIINRNLESAQNHLDVIKDRFDQYFSGLITHSELNDQVFRGIGSVMAAIQLAYQAAPIQEEVDRLFGIEASFPKVSETELLDVWPAATVEAALDLVEQKRKKPGILLCPPIGAPDADIIAWVHSTHDFLSDDECLKAHNIYRCYRDEGYPSAVARQYAGLIIPGSEEE